MGLPAGWVDMMKRSIAAYAPLFNTDRMVADYARHAYLRGLESWRDFCADGLHLARELSEWERKVREAWPAVSVESVTDDASEFERSRPIRIVASVSLGSLQPDEVRVEAVSGPVAATGLLDITARTQLRPAQVSPGSCKFEGTVTWDRAGTAGYAVRLTPFHLAHPDLVSLGLVRWSGASGT
jgi:starch phosphorylase